MSERNTRTGRRSFVKGLGGVTALGSLAGCVSDITGSGQSSGNNSSQSSGSGATTLDLIFFDGQSTKKQDKALRNRIDQYEKESGNTVNVSTGATAAEVTNQVRTGIKAGGGPDVIMTPDLSILSLASDGLLEPLDDRISNASFKKGDFSDIMVNLGSGYEDTMWGLPVMVGHWGSLYYNANVFKQAGLDPMNPDFKTWPEFFEVAKTIKQETGVRPIGFSGADHFQSTIQWTGLYTTTGAETWLNDDKTEAIIDQEPGVKTMQIYEKAKNEDLLPKGAVSTNASGMRQLFMEDKTAMYHNGAWEKGILQEKYDGDFGITWLPQAPNGRPSGFGGGWFWTLNKKSDVKDVGWELIKYLNDVDTMLDWTALAPAFKDGLERRFDGFQDGLGREVGNIFVEEIKNSGFVAFHPEMPTISDKFLTEFQKVVGGQKSSEKAVSDAAEKINGVIS